MRNMQKFDVLVAGEINPDLILTGDIVPEFGQVEKLVDSATLAIGSSSAIFACGAARLGLKVGFIGVCGDDVFGRFMLDRMSARGIDTFPTLIDSSRQTGLSIILVRGTDRAILTHLGTIADLRAEQVTDDLLKQTRHLHVASYFLQTNLQHGLKNLFQRAHQLDVTTSLDTNWDIANQWNGLDELLSLTDVFLPNENEALAITREDKIENAIRKLAEQSKIVAVKLGAEGALACSQNISVQSKSISVKAVDTVGAGDSFDAGFIYGYLNNWRIEKSLRLACVCGALSTQKAGGTEGQPTLDEAMKHVS